MTLPTQIDDLEKQKFYDVADGSTAVKSVNSSGGELATETTLAAASAKLPATLGQKAMAASMSVAVASNQSDVPVNFYGATAVEPPRKTFSAAATFTAADSPTDIFTIYGPSSGTVYITKIVFHGTQSSNGLANVYILRRSTAASGGTPVTVTPVPHKTGDATTATVTYYTANPTVGTLVGNIYAERNFMGVTTTYSYPLKWEADFFSKPIALASASEGVAINLDASTRSGNVVTCYVEFIQI